MDSFDFDGTALAGERNIGESTGIVNTLSIKRIDGLNPIQQCEPKDNQLRAFPP